MLLEKGYYDPDIEMDRHMLAFVFITYSGKQYGTLIESEARKRHGCLKEFQTICTLFQKVMVPKNVVC